VRRYRRARHARLYAGHPRLAFTKLEKTWMAFELGLARVRQILKAKSGKPDLGDKPGHDDI
jgi:hypothetical protein